MPCQLGNNSFFDTNNYIKFLNSDIVAIEGPNTIERLIASDIRIPYKQVLKGRIILKEGQLNYLMNHLGLGDNATFLAVLARYDSRSVNEEDNYIEYYYSDDTSKMRYMSQVLILTGNSTHRIPQLYFNNPNTSYKVTLDVMVGVIDETYTFFQDTTNQSGLSFYNLECNSTKNCIETFVTNESFVVYDTNVPRNPLAYIINNDITSINIKNDIIIIDSETQGKLFLQFVSSADAKQAYSLINYIIENQDIIVDGVDMDTTPPVVYFYSHVNNDNTKSYIMMNGATSGAPFNTGLAGTVSLTFSATFSLAQYGDLVYGEYTMTKSDIYNILIDGVSDTRDGDITLDNADVILKDYDSNTIVSINQSGTYSLYFNLSDLAGNYVNTNTYVLLSVSS